MDMVRRFGLHYLAPIENLKSILELGILSRTTMLELGLEFGDISDSEVQLHRQRSEPIFGRPIHDYVPLYLNPKNAMLSRRREHQHQLAVLRIDPDAVLSLETIYTDGNAAAAHTEFSLDPDVMLGSLEALESNYWPNVFDGKRRRMAEVLIYESVPPEAIQRAICNNHYLAQRIHDEYGLYAAVDTAQFF